MCVCVCVCVCVCGRAESSHAARSGRCKGNHQARARWLDSRVSTPHSNAHRETRTHSPNGAPFDGHLVVHPDIGGAAEGWGGGQPPRHHTPTTHARDARWCSWHLLRCPVHSGASRPHWHTQLLRVARLWMRTHSQTLQTDAAPRKTQTWARVGCTPRPANVPKLHACDTDDGSPQSDAHASAEDDWASEVHSERFATHCTAWEPGGGGHVFFNHPSNMHRTHKNSSTAIHCTPSSHYALGGRGLRGRGLRQTRWGGSQDRQWSGPCTAGQFSFERAQWRG